MTIKTQLPSIETPTFISKIDRLKKMFAKHETAEEKYHLLINFGKNLATMEEGYKIKENLVKGCQSLLYLHASKQQDQIFFTAATDALISKGLAALLIYVYSGESIETILTNPPLFLQELGLYTALSPNRSQGLYHIYLKIRALAIKL